MQIYGKRYKKQMEERAMSAMRRLLSACVPGDILEGTVDAIEPTGITVVSSHKVAKVLELQLQHQSFQ